MLITPAFAQGGATGSLNDLLSSPLFVMIPIFVIMYFFILRPQQRRAKQHQEMVKNLRRGDTEIGRASCRERGCALCRSRWSPYH